ncbi:MAG: PspC domain-containing protein [Sphaerochaetaceae bacterium]
MATKKLYRSKNGMFLGVCKGIAEWKDFPVGTVRLVFLVLLFFAKGFPIVAVYLILALILPVNSGQTEEDKPFEERIKEFFNKDNYKPGHFYYDENEKREGSYSTGMSDEDLKQRFDKLKNRVNNMEEDLFDKENDWESRFNSAK